MLGSMKTGLFNLAFGLVALVAGATGQFAFIGTSSSSLLMIAGGLVAALGVLQIWQSRGR
jgi:hypothetical protein